MSTTLGRTSDKTGFEGQRKSVSGGLDAGAMETLRVDCGRCQLRGLWCEDCVVSVLLGPDVGSDLSFTAVEQVAVAILAESGLVPPLRLLQGDVAARGVRGGVTNEISTG